MTSQDLWIWRAFFGTACSNNDINVLNTSNVFDEVLSWCTPAVQYTVNETQYDIEHYLTYDIYPYFVTFVNIISMSQGEKRKLYVKWQKSTINDVERAFGVL